MNDLRDPDESFDTDWNWRLCLVLAALSVFWLLLGFGIRRLMDWWPLNWWPA